MATALLNSFMVIGGAAGTFLTGRLLGPMGWRNLFVAFAVPGLLWWCCGSPSGSAAVPKITPASTPPSWRSSAVNRRRWRSAPPLRG